MQSKIYFGDYREFAEKIPSGSVDLILTDPPWYYKKKPYLGGRTKDKDKKPVSPGLKGEYPSYLDFAREMFGIFNRVLKPTGNLAIFHSYTMIPTLIVTSFPAGFRFHRVFVWIQEGKPGGKGIKGRNEETGFANAIEFITIFKKDNYKPYYDAKAVLDLFPSGRAMNYYITPASKSSTHKSVFNFMGEKTDDILRIMVRALCPPGGIVYDPFLGSGSIIPVCCEEGRIIIGSEIDEIAQDMIRHRILESGCDIEIVEGSEKVAVPVSEISEPESPPDVESIDESIEASEFIKRLKSELRQRFWLIPRPVLGRATGMEKKGWKLLSIVKPSSDVKTWEFHFTHPDRAYKTILRADGTYYTRPIDVTKLIEQHKDYYKKLKKELLEDMKKGNENKVRDKLLKLEMCAVVLYAFMKANNMQPFSKKWDRMSLINDIIEHLKAEAMGKIEDIEQFSQQTLWQRCLKNPEDCEVLIGRRVTRRGGATYYIIVRNMKTGEMEVYTGSTKLAKRMARLLGKQLKKYIAEDEFGKRIHISEMHDV